MAYVSTDVFFSNIDAAWLTSHLDGRAVSHFSIDSTDLDKLNKTSALRYSNVHFADGGCTRLVFKVSPPSSTVVALGLAREALFYQKWSRLATAVACSPCQLGQVLPRVYHSSGSMETGEKLILMEDLQSEESGGCVQLGYLFSAIGDWPGNPNNWNKDLSIVDSLPRQIDVREATMLAFSVAAKIHAPFWRCAALFEHPWLRGAEWMKGAKRDEWEKAQHQTATQWAEVKAKIAQKSDYKVRWDPLLVACVDAAIEKTNWDDYQAELRSRPFTLVHGDFHPANLLLVNRGQHLRLVDFEAVGVGSGPQEIGQFMISHLEPTVRASIERDVVAAYYAELINANGSIDMTFDQCWSEYVMGGLGRWLFFLPYDGWGAPPATSQFFCDQVSTFIQAHGVTPDNIPMPRL